MEDYIKALTFLKSSSVMREDSNEKLRYLLKIYYQPHNNFCNYYKAIMLPLSTEKLGNPEKY